MIEIYLADWTFYLKQSGKDKLNSVPVRTYIIKDIITKRIPLIFILNEGMSYYRAINQIPDSFLKTLQNDENTKLKKFTITFTKKIGEVNETEN